VIQGRIRNDFPAPRRWIHLRAKLYTTDTLAARSLTNNCRVCLSKSWWG
jgi:hypothetical protein